MTGFRYATYAFGAQVLCATIAYGAVISNVDSADDVCPLSADPCVITDTIDIVDGSTLDFGARRVEVTGDGVLDVGIGSVDVVCSSFLGDKPGRSIVNAREPGSDDSGHLSIFAVGACSGDAARACISIEDCDLGSCTNRSCTENRNLGCGSDSDCVLTCDGGECAGTGENCVVDSDCDFGACRGSCGSTEVACADDSQCALGACVGDPRGIELNARIDARGRRFGSSIDLFAAGDVKIRDVIDLSADNGTDAGKLDVEAGGRVLVDAPIVAVGGPHGFGGEVFLDSQGDTIVNAPIEISGGEFDGGLFWISDSANAIVAADITANGTFGGGWGGDIMIDSDGDITFADGIRITANGSTGDGFNGSGGSLDVSADGDVDFGRARYSLRGGRAFSFGGYVYVHADGDATIRGRWNTGARGQDKGSFGVDADRDITVESDTLLKMRNGGDVELTSDRDIFFDGYLRENNVFADSFIRLEFDAGRSISLSGRIDIIGTDVRGWTRFTADCSMELLPSAKIRTRTGFENLFRAQSFSAGGGSYVESLADQPFRVTTASGSPPVLDGTFKPAAVLATGSFTPCP